MSAGFIKHTLSYFYPELRASLENPSTPLSAFDTEPKTVAKISVTPEGSLAIGTVFACVKVIAETMAMMDCEVMRSNGKVRSADITHPVYRLVSRDPSPLYTRFDFTVTIMTHILLWGNAYAEIIRSRFGDPLELRILLPWNVTPKLTERGRLFYEVQNDDGSMRVIMPDNILHYKNIGTNGLVGMSNIAIQRENMANSIAKQQHEGAFYSNGAKASGILMTPGTMGLKEKNNLETSFSKVNEGPKNRFRTIVLEEGVKYQQLTIPQNDAQFLESKKFDRTEIAGWFRTPPHMIGHLDDANYSNVDAMDRSFAKNTIVPWTTRIQLENDRKLFFEDERGFFTTQYNLDDLIKGDMKTRYESWAVGINNGFVKPKWAVESEGWPTDNAPELDKFYVQGAVVPLDMAGQQQSQPPKDIAA